MHKHSAASYSVGGSVERTLAVKNSVGGSIGQSSAVSNSASVGRLSAVSYSVGQNSAVLYSDVEGMMGMEANEAVELFAATYPEFETK